jgi:hypothetical protein
MKPLHAFASVLCLAALLASASPRGTRLVFAPDPSVKVRKTVTQTSTTTLESMQMTINGEPKSTGEIDDTGSSSATYVFTDEYKQVEHGKLLAVLRSVDEANEVRKRAQTTFGPTRHVERELTTELTGKSIAFSFDARLARWARESAGERVRAELLAGLEPEFDLIGFLPTDEVAPGESWQVDAPALIGLLCPGGDLVMKSDRDPPTERASELAMRKALAGKGKATFRALNEEHGVPIATIDFEAELTSTWEVDRDGAMDVAPDHCTQTLRIRGELAWNTARNRAEHAQLEREGTLEIRSRHAMTKAEETFAIETESVFKLTGKDEISFAPAP